MATVGESAAALSPTMADSAATLSKAAARSPPRVGAGAHLLAAWLTANEARRVAGLLPKGSPWAAALLELNRRHRERLAAEKPTARPFCQHEGTCPVNAVRGFVRTFLLAGAGKYLLAVLPALLKGRVFTDPKLLWKLAGSDHLRFGLFLASFVGVYKGCNCMIRHARRTEDNWNSLVAGALAGLTLAVDDKSRRMALALYISTRTLEFAYNYLNKRGYLPTVPHGDTLVMAIASAQIIYALVFEQDTLACGWRQKSYFAFLLVHGGFAKHGKLAVPWLNVLRSLASRERVDLTPFKDILKTYPTPLEQLQVAPTEEMLHACMHPGSESCTVGAGQFFLSEMPNALRLYVPLNVVMSLLFKRNQLISKPGTFLWKTAMASLRSSVFLTMYCTISLLMPCYFRNIFGRDYRFAYYLNGFCGGLCVLLEQKPRRIELAMYCAPRALESFWNQMVKHGRFRNIPYGRAQRALGGTRNGEVAYFAVAMAVLLTIYQNEPDNLNGTYRSALEHLVGKN